MGSGDKGNTTGFLLDSGASLAASNLISTATDDINRVNVNGSLQFSESIGIGFALIFSEIERRTRNNLQVALSSNLAISDIINLQAINSGSITTVSVAGTISQEDSKFGDDSNSKIFGLNAQDANNWQASLAGSVGWSTLNNQTQNTINTSSGQAPVAPNITFAAIDKTGLNNWSGALAYGKTGAVIPSDAGPKQRSGQFTIAGALAANQINRDTNNTINGVTISSSSSAPISLSSDTRGAFETAGAISLSVGVGSGTNIVFPGSIALNLDLESSGSSTTSTVSNFTGTNLSNSLSLSAIEGADATAIAGSLGIAANPLSLDNTVSTKPSTAATFRLSVAINDLKTVTTASLSDSTITASSPAGFTITARTDEVNLTTAAISAAGSAAMGTKTPGFGSYAIAGSGAGAENAYDNPISASIANSNIQGISTLQAPSITLIANSDEEILAITGGLDIAVALAKQDKSPAGSSLLALPHQ